jgi:hypothetical protein
MSDPQQVIGAEPRRRFPNVALLNDAIGLPSIYARELFAGHLDVDVYLLDYNYLDRARTETCLEDLARLLGPGAQDRTLLLAARGLDPHGLALLAFARRFARHHVFFEGWNKVSEISELASLPPDNLYLLPVTAAMDLGRYARRPHVANHRVFVSLGGDDQLDLVREIIRQRRDMSFYVPELTWIKEGLTGAKSGVMVVDEPNAMRVACVAKERGFAEEYLDAYAICDTVLVVTSTAKIQQMRGGIRVADAIRCRKRLVLARNPMCELLMAQPERTCVVAEHDAEALSNALVRAVDGRFFVDEPLCEAIRSLTDEEAKLSWMVNVPGDPAAARRSPFWRRPAELLRQLRDSNFVGADKVPLEELFDLRQGQQLLEPDLDVRVETITQSGDATFEVTLSAAGGPWLEVLLSTAPVPRYFRRTSRGHYVWHAGSTLTPDRKRALEQLAEHL